MARIGMRELLEAGAHFGHQTQRWNPKMKRYIYNGPRQGIYIIDLSMTVALFDKAAKFITETVANGKPVLFVGTKKQAQDIIREEAERAGQYFVTNRWLGGTLTNWQTIKKSIARLRDIEKMQADGTAENLTKKEGLRLERMRIKLERNLGGIKDMGKMPGAVFLVDPKKEHIAVNEANIMGIPLVAIVDTNCNPDPVDWVIPGNDDAIRSIRLFAARLADACLEGKAVAHERRQEMASSAAHVGDDATVTVSPGPREGAGPQVQRVVKRAKNAPKPEIKAAQPKAETKPAEEQAKPKAETKPAEEQAKPKAETKPAEEQAKPKAETKPAEEQAKPKAEAKSEGDQK